MSIYRISSVVLARGVGVDPSLVSRWRSGERVPAENSSVCAEIGAFLSGRPMLPHDRAALFQTVGRPCESREELARAVADYLSKVRVEPVRPATRNPPVLGALGLALGGFFDARPPAHTGPVNLWPQVQKGQPAEHEIFRGNQGKRQAAINFIHLVLSSPRPLQVCLCTDGDTGWITENEDFAALWERCLHTLCRGGHTIHRIHMGALDADGLLRALDADMPLYATGRCRLYACPALAAPAHTALFVARGFAVMDAYRTPDGGGYATLFKGPQDTEAYGDIMARCLDESARLLQIFRADVPGGLAAQLALLEDKPGRCFSCLWTPGLLHLPDNVLFDILRDRMKPSAADARLDALARRRELFAEGRDYRMDIWPAHVLDAILINESCRIAGAELSLPEDVIIRGQAVLDMLLHTRGMLRAPHYSLCLADELPLSCDIHLKEALGCIFFGSAEGGPGAAVWTEELGLLSTLNAWFEGIARKDGADAAGRLDETIRILRGS